MSASAQSASLEVLSGLSAHSLGHNDLCQHSPGLGTFRKRSSLGAGAVYVCFPLTCGRSTCPACARRLRKRLAARLRASLTGRTAFLWTITTDPSVLDKAEALRTINKRWHVVHRSLTRLCPGLTYFRVIEFTRSGLPHIHLVTPRFLPWKQVQKFVTASGFGRILHVRPLPTETAIHYVAKYTMKALYTNESPRLDGLRLWAATVGFLVAWSKIAPRSDLAFVALTWINQRAVNDYWAQMRDQIPSPSLDP
jgi:hypothetical protein